MKKLVRVLVVLLLIGLAFFAIDYSRVQKQKKPIFCIPFNALMDGGTKEYLGLGYKVIAFHRIEPIENDATIEIVGDSIIETKDKPIGYYDKIHIGSWFMTTDSALRQTNKGVTTIQIKNVEFVRTYTVLKDLDKADKTGKYNYYVIEQEQSDKLIVIQVEKTFSLEENTKYEFTFEGSTSEGMRYSISEIFDSFKITNIEMIDKVDVGKEQHSIIDETENNPILGQTFYATIEDITDNRMLVDGLEINDINYRGKYSFNVQDTTILEWRFTPIDLSDLKVGNTISITFTGDILTSSPGQILNVLRIQLLDDEK